MNRMKLLVCVVSVMFILQIFQIECCLQNERLALLQIKSYFSRYSDPKYEGFPSWPVGDDKSDCCKWESVECSPSTRHVTDLYLSHAVSQIGVLPLDMTLFQPFQELNTLDLSHNSIGSFVRSEGLSMSKKFQRLDLSGNFLIGHLPDFIWNLSSLRVLDLSNALVAERVNVSLCRLRNIRELYIAYDSLSGSLPSCLLNLTSLQVLDLSHNYLSGNLPSHLNLPSLQLLSIGYNYFEGKFSLSSFNNHSSLEGLVLSNSGLQVEIDESFVPSSTMQLQLLALANCNLSLQIKTLQKFSSLRHIDLSDTSLTGSFPAWLLLNNSHLEHLNLRSNLLIGDLDLPQKNNLSLLLLDISNNQLRGEIPHRIGTLLSTINALLMSNNSFVGLIPPSISNMTQLLVLDLSNNQLVGEVPQRIFSSCSNLSFLAVSNNRLDGEIIPNNMNLPFLKTLSLENNHFVGTLQESLKYSTTLEYLNIGNNVVSGELPCWIGNLWFLDFMSLERNQIYGNIPSSMCDIHEIYYLDLSENNFTGEIPSCGLGSSLEHLHLHDNSLTGTIPNGLSRSLLVLNLASNHLSGGIPSWINVFSKLTVLLLGNNRLQGTLPIQLCQLQQLNILSLTNNSISEVVLPCLQYLSLGSSNFGILAARESLIYYAIPIIKLKDPYTPEAYDVLRSIESLTEVSFIVKSRYASYQGNILKIMSALDLSCNQLTGAIHPDLGNLKNLNTMNFSHNYLSGPIPESFSWLTSIESLDLSFNKLSGTIPPQLAVLNSLEVFNVSYNNLSGEVPATAQFGTFDERNYLGNPLLCGSNLVKKCTVKEPPSSSSTEWIDEEDDPFDMEVFFWSFGVSFIIVLLTLFLVFYINSEWRRAWSVFIDIHLLWWLY